MILPRDFSTDANKKYESADFEVRSYILGDYICTIDLNSLLHILSEYPTIRDKIVKFTFPVDTDDLKRFLFIDDPIRFVEDILSNDGDTIKVYTQQIDMNVDEKQLKCNTQNLGATLLMEVILKAST